MIDKWIESEAEYWFDEMFRDDIKALNELRIYKPKEVIHGKVETETETETDSSCDEGRPYA